MVFTYGLLTVKIVGTSRNFYRLYYW